MILLDKERDGEVFTQFFACDGVDILQKTETAVKSRWCKRVKELKKSQQDPGYYVSCMANRYRFAQELRAEFEARIKYEVDVARVAMQMCTNDVAHAKALDTQKKFQGLQGLLDQGEYNHMFEQCAEVWACMPEEIPN